LQIVADAGIPIFVQKGFEADDLIATMVHRLAGREDLEIVIVSKDKDLRQLIGPRVADVRRAGRFRFWTARDVQRLGYRAGAGD
jgi:5'-3' exonuclease